MTRQLLSYGDEDGVLLTGASRQIISGVGATRTLKASESGALCLLDRAAGVVYTLPAITSTNIGMSFEFQATVSVTSNAYKVITGAATQFLVGAVVASSLTAGAQDTFVANGTTHVAISAAGSTTGGLIGERYVVTAVSATQWVIHGVTQGSGTLADPFATS
jgi:hypothetical protein